jgi:Domain of unknown function DUF11/Bacterial lectin
MFNQDSPTPVRRNRVPRTGVLVARCASLLLLALDASQVHAQFKVTQSFTGTSAPGWTLTGNAFLTAPSIDPVGSGWLRLTAAATAEKGVALYTGGSFVGAQPLVMKFSYVSWGGTGADGIGLFLYDSTQDMSGAYNGGGLGYCQGAGGYLGIGLDEYGNFSTANHCTSGGPGFAPESLVIRGPVGTGNPYVTGIVVPGGIDVPSVSTRPSARTVLVTLMPEGTGFSVSAQYQPASGQPYQTLFSGVSFPYTPPASLSVGISGSTGGATNVHEVQDLTVSSPDDLQVVMTGPANIAPGNAVNYQITVTNNGPTAISLPDSPTITDDLDPTLQGANWTCVASVGASCSSSGTGAIDDSSLSLPVNGTATYTVNSTLSPAATCGGQITSSATGDFGATSRFADYSPSNNTSSVSTTINCSSLTLMGNPSSLSFSPQGVGSSSQPLTITLSGNGGPIVTGVSASGDFSETNNCPATPLVGSATCTVTVTFKPTAEGSRSGALTITSDAPSSPLSIALSGVGANTTPDPFSFTALNGVDPSRLEVSNAVTVEGTNTSSPISITGGTYSINGGPFTAAPGYVSPGAHVVVSLESSASYLTATSAHLTIGGVAATFTVTTRAVMPGALSFGSAAYTASGSDTSAPITVTRTGGTDGTVTFDIVDASGAVLGQGSFAAGVGGVETIAIPLSNDAGGAVLPLRIVDITGGAIPGTIAAATLTVTAAPLAGVVVRSGGVGAVSPLMLLMLGLVTVMRFARGRWCWVLAASLALLQVRGSQAAETDAWWSNLSIGARLGVTTSTLTNTEISDQLAGAGFDVAADVSRSATAKTLLIDYALPKNFGVDFAWGYLGNTRIALSGTTPVNLNALLNDAAYDARGSGSDVSLSLRYRWILPEAAAWSLETRGGAYRWRTDTRVWLGPVLALERVDRGIGYTVGVGPRYQATRTLGVSVNFDYFYSTSENRFWQETIGADYRF